MTLHYYGLSCFRLQSNIYDVTVLIDPVDQGTGWKMPRVTAEIILSSDANVQDTQGKSKDGAPPFMIHNPGEYEVKNIFIYGFNVPKKNQTKQSSNTNIFVVGIDDMYVGHLGSLDRVLTEKELDELGHVDVLLLPVGGGSVCDPKTAVEIVTQIEPRIVVPMMFGLPGLKADLRDVGDFLKEFGVKDNQPEEKLKLMKKDLPADDTKVVILNPV